MLTARLPTVRVSAAATNCGQNSWHTLLKILPCPNFVAGGNYGVDVVILSFNTACDWSERMCCKNVVISEIHFFSWNGSKGQIS